MTVRPGFPAVTGAATFQDIRRSFGGMVVKSAAGVLRTGILPIGTGPLMVGTASMVVNVQTCVVVLDRNGAVFLPNDGVQTVTLSSAPSSGSRWSIVYAKQRETEAPFSDTAAGPLIDKVESTTSETAARNLLPSGARELAVWKIDAGVTTTNAGSGVTYTETVPYTAMEGGIVLLRNQTEQDAWAPHDGSAAYRMDTKTMIYRAAGAWVQEKPAVTRFVRTATSDASVGSGTYIGLVEGTITNAPAGLYLVLARASIYANGSNVVGRVYAEWGPTSSPVREEARWDLPNTGTYPVSATVSAFITHPGGDLRIATGYRRDTGTFAVTSQASGETVVTAVLLGPA